MQSKKWKLRNGLLAPRLAPELGGGAYVKIKIKNPWAGLKSNKIKMTGKQAIQLSPTTKRTMPASFNSPKRADSIRYKITPNEKKLKQLQRTPEQLPYNRRRQQSSRYIHPKNKTHQRNVEKEIEKEIEKAHKEISDLKKNSISNIQKISENIASNIIETISGDKLNESSIKAAVEDISKKNLNKYL